MKVRNILLNVLIVITAFIAFITSIAVISIQFAQPFSFALLVYDIFLVFFILTLFILPRKIKKMRIFQNSVIRMFLLIVFVFISLTIINTNFYLLQDISNLW